MDAYRELSKHLRTAQRRMLRKIFGAGRRIRQRQEKETTSSEEESEKEEEKEEEEEEKEDGEKEDKSGELESWIEWLQRVTEDVETHCEWLNLESWLALQRRRKWRWAGHVARLCVHDGDRWAAQVLTGRPKGGPRQQEYGLGRVQGRPQIWWDDVLQRFFKKQGVDGDFWRILAILKDDWKNLEDEFANDCLK